MPGLPVHHQLPEFTQTHVHGVGDAIQPSLLMATLKTDFQLTLRLFNSSVSPQTLLIYLDGPSVNSLFLQEKHTLTYRVRREYSLMTTITVPIHSASIQSQDP